MDHVRPLSAQVEQYVLRWRTYRGRPTAHRYLNLLAVALEPRGWRLVRHYPPHGLSAPLLWVHTGAPNDHAGLGVIVLAIQGGAWGYHDSQRGRRGYLAPCGDTIAAAEQVEDLLKHRMFPGTW
jgi:hypothetical protein